MDTSNRLISIHILEILNKYSSKDKKMGQAELMKHLEEDYDEKITRRTCSDYLKELRLNGYIEGSRGIYRRDLFTERELRTLIDGVMYGKHIPEKQADQLINKLKTLSLNTMKDKAKSISYFSGINRTDNPNLYEILDVIDKAIEENKKIIIYQYSPLPDGSKSEWSPKIVDPYYVVSDQSRYYLLCNTNRDGNLRLEPRRVDRFLNVEILDEQRTNIIDVVGHEFDLGRYMREHIYMFSGDSTKVIIKIKSKDIGALIDWCGPSYTILNQDEEYTTVSIKTNEDAAYYWALQYGGIAEIVEPIELRNKIKAGLEEILDKYK